MTSIIKAVCRLILISFIAVIGLLGPAMAQETTSSLRVTVIDEAGKGVPNVGVRITHVPTGRTVTLQSNNSGNLTASGLAVGGPYEVAITDTIGFAYDVSQGIYLELDKTGLVTLVARSGMEEVVVTAQASTAELLVGVSRNFGKAELLTVPSISRDFVSTLAIDPKIMVDNSVARGPAVSLAGQNFRFNSVTIDGVPQNDNFGLSKNASATQRSPISIDAIEGINVNIAPYDVSYGNFIGGNINIVTKSGTNDFSGSVYYFNTDDSFTGDETDGVKLGLGDFKEGTFGFTVGGPIIKDKFFFFANYEKFETTRPSNSQTIANISGVNQEDVDRVINILQTQYGFDPGQFATTDKDEDEKMLLKLDWYISDLHRAVATYQVADGDVLFDDFPTLAALQSNRYNINEKMNAWSLHLFSNWTANLTTEVKLGFKDVENRQKSFDGTTNEFEILAPEFGSILAGGDRFRHANELDNKSDIFRIKADYFLGDHILTAGWERESKTVRNLFLPFSKGNFFFSSIDNLENRVADFVLYGNSNTGVAADAEARFTLDVDSIYLQDEWRPSDDLTLSFGVRFDMLSNDDPIKDNPNFLARRGFSNTENLDGKELFQPRLGFNWEASERLRIRGGAGLFGGGSPLIILSNSYAGDGISRTFASFLAPFFGPEYAEAINNAVMALPDQDAAFEFLQPFIGVNPIGQTDAIDPDYQILSTWKYSLGADYLADLSGIGMGDDWKFAADVIISDVKNGYDIYEARRTVVDTAPDGRPIYDLPADADYITTNTDKGGGTVFTFRATKTFDTDKGLFHTNFGYTHQDMEELRSYNRFVTFETLTMDPSTDLNNPGVAQSRYEVPSRVTANLTWQKEIFGGNMSTLALVYSGRSGRHFSYVFGSNGVATFGGNFLADFGSEGDNPGSQLFYVPTGINDPLVTGDAQFLADLDEFISNTPTLDAIRGSIAPRNVDETDWVNMFSMRIQQEVRFNNGIKFDLMVDIENLGNLINSDWGRVDSYTAPSNLAVANVAIADGQYVLTPTSSYTASGGADSIIPRPEIAALPSVYRVQLGARFRF